MRGSQKNIHFFFLFSYIRFPCSSFVVEIFDLVLEWLELFLLVDSCERITTTTTAKSIFIITFLPASQIRKWDKVLLRYYNKHFLCYSISFSFIFIEKLNSRSAVGSECVLVWYINMDRIQYNWIVFFLIHTNTETWW